MFRKEVLLEEVASISLRGNEVFIKSLFGKERSVRGALSKIGDGTEATLLSSLSKDAAIASIPRDSTVFLRGLEGKELDVRLTEVSKVADILVARERSD